MGALFGRSKDLKIDAKFGTPGTDVLASIRSTAYKWTASGSGTDEYHLELAAGGDPGLAEPSAVYEDGSAMTAGTAGSLTAGKWDFGDNDTLGYDTIYVRLTATGDPDSQAVDFVQISATDAIALSVQLIDRQDRVELGEAVGLFWYLSSDSAGQVVPSAPDGGIAIGTDGTLIEWTANLSGLLIFEADGDADVIVTESGDNSFYLNLVMPDGDVQTSAVLDFN